VAKDVRAVAVPKGRQRCAVSQVPQRDRDTHEFASADLSIAVIGDAGTWRRVVVCDVLRTSKCTAGLGLIQ